MKSLCSTCERQAGGTALRVFAGLCSRGGEATVRCSGCGVVGVDHLGNRLWKARRVGIDKETLTGKMLRLATSVDRG